MKVLYFTNSFGSTTTTFIYQEVVQMAHRSGVEVSVITSERVNNDKFPFESIRVIPFPYTSMWYKLLWQLYKNNLILSYYSPGYAKKITQAIDDFKPDVIHCHFGDVGLMLLDNFNNKNNIPVFIHFHGYDASQKLNNSLVYRCRIKKALQQSFIHPIFVANHMYEEVLGKGITADKKRVLYCGIDVTKFKRSKAKSSHKVFLQVSSFREKKGHRYTLFAFSKFLTTVTEPSQYRLILAGGGPGLEEIQDLAKDLNIADQVIFPGWVTHQEAKQLMDEADFFVHHSITSSSGDKEGLPNAIIEAMAMELPILATNHAGIPELVKDGVNGFLVNEGDIEHYAAKLKEILSWNYLPQNRERVKTMFEVQQHNNLLFKYYQEAKK